MSATELSWRVLIGDVRDRLATLPDASVQCCVTSPPYWGLRDYGTAQWNGGDGNCDHKPTVRPRTERPDSGLTGSKSYMVAQESVFRDVCGKCGATRLDRQIGLESTPDAYVAEMVGVFREVRRVLKDDGTLWLNLGDSYNGSGPSGGPGKQYTNVGSQGTTTKAVAGLKTKDLIGIPWRVAFALQADGWYLRSDIIWHKPNPMPESVTDRPTKSHEYVFLFTKAERYFYDAEAIRESGNKVGTLGHLQGGNGARAGTRGGLRREYVAAKRLNPGSQALDSFEVCGDGLYSQRRNARSVWTIATQPFAGAHFATFPEAIPERCIKAGSRVGDVILDPFTGSGTTGQVAIQLGRSFVGCELNPAYAELARTRIGGAAPLFAREAA